MNVASKLAVATVILLFIGGCHQEDKSAKTKAADVVNQASDKKPGAVTADVISAAPTIDQVGQGMVAMFKKLAAATEEHSDCDELAGAFKVIIDDNKPLLAADELLKAKGKKTAGRTKYGTEMMSLTEMMSPALAKCQTNKNLEEALKPLLGG